MATEGNLRVQIGYGEESEAAGPRACSDEIARRGETNEACRAFASDLSAKEVKGREVRFDGFTVFDVCAEGDFGKHLLTGDAGLSAGEGVAGDVLAGFEKCRNAFRVKLFILVVALPLAVAGHRPL